MRISLVLVVVVVCVAGTMALPQETGRKRRVRKKIVKVETDSDSTGQEVKKAPRGFLDDYYSQFENRVERKGVFPAPDSDAVASTRHSSVQQSTTGAATGYNVAVAVPAPDLVQSQRRQDGGQLQLTDEELEELLRREEELSRAEREELARQLAAWPGQQHQQHAMVQQLVLPKGKPDNDAYLYSSVLADDTRFNEISSPGVFSPFKNDQTLTPFGLGPIATVEEADIDDVSRFTSSGYISPGDVRASGTTAQSATKYFGITGTTSQDIQLGLTFTVPFLSIPLSSINSLLGGNLGDLTNFFNFDNIDTTTLIMIGVIALSAIFILPQAIYWLTGTNLSAFNWARSEDGEGLVSIANTVDRALAEFDIDSRSCLAKTFCSTLQHDGAREFQQSPFTLSTVVRYLSSNPLMEQYLGSSLLSRVKLAAESGQDCPAVFSSTCPWDPAAMTHMMLKFMANSDLNLADIAMKAATATMAAAAAN